MKQTRRKRRQHYLKVVGDGGVQQETGEEARARWMAGFAARARGKAADKGIEYDVARLQEIAHANERIIDYLQAYRPFVEAVMAMPNYFLSDDEDTACRMKVDLIQKVVEFLPDELLEFLGELDIKEG